MAFMANLNYVVVAVLGAWKITSGSLSLGEVQAFIQYSAQFSHPIMQAAGAAAQLQSGIASARRIFELLDAPEQTGDPYRPELPSAPAGRVEFQRLSFRYQPDQPLIEDLSLVVEPGQTVAIVGPTGAGKTTLGNLLLRFYELDQGRILVDGVPTTRMPLVDLRAMTGLVAQDPWLFHGTVAENIGYGRPGAGIEQIRRAAAAAYVHHFVELLPMGYDTVLDDETSNLSAGQRQLITVARAFVAEPTILILDEATGSVDTRTEALIQQALTGLRTGRTCFVIAHRLSTIRHADLIVVMESGRIVETGRHEELLAADGRYAALYAAQFAEAMVEVG